MRAMVHGSTDGPRRVPHWLCIPASVGLTFGTAGCGITVEAKTILDVRAIGAGATCAAGGQEVLSGVDADGDGRLFGDEITGRAPVCFPGSTSTTSAGGLPSPVLTTSVQAEASCTRLTVTVGLDSDGSGSLESGEPATTSSQCLPLPSMSASDLAAVQGLAAANADALGRISTSTTVPSTLIVRPSPANDEYARLDLALAFLEGKTLTQPVTIQLSPGTYDQPAPITIDHPQAQLIQIVGQATPITSSSPPNVSLRFNGTDGIELLPDTHLGLLQGVLLEDVGAPVAGTTGLRVLAGASLPVQFVEVRNFVERQFEVNGGLLTRGPASVSGSNLNLIIRCSAPSDVVGYFNQGIASLSGAQIDLGEAHVQGCGYGLWASSGTSFNAYATRFSGSGIALVSEYGAMGVIGSGVVIDNSTTISMLAAFNGGALYISGAFPTGTGNTTPSVQVADGSLLRITTDDLGTPVNCGNVVCDSTAIIRGCIATCSTTP